MTKKVEFVLIFYDWKKYVNQLSNQNISAESNVIFLHNVMRFASDFFTYVVKVCSMYVHVH